MGSSGLSDCISQGVIKNKEGEMDPKYQKDNPKQTDAKIVKRQDTKNVNYQESQVAISMCFSQKLQLIATTKFVISISTSSIPKLSGPCRLFGIWSTCLKFSAFCLHEAYRKQGNLFDVLPLNTGAYLDTQWVQGL